MAHFEIDRQTINDLGLFNEDDNSVYSFFNNVKTIGGEKKLKEMMETPSFDEQVLNSRKNTIQYFYDKKITLPLIKKDLDFIEHYLTFNFYPLKSDLFNVLTKGIKYHFNPDNNYYIITQGIKDVLKLVKILADFNDNLVVENSPLPISNIKEVLEGFFSKKAIKKLISTNPEEDLGYKEVSYYDNLFRKAELVALTDLLKIIYESDAYIAIAKTVEHHGFCFPEYDNINQAFVNISGLHHPCIKNAVRNDVLIEQEKNIFFLTGANMAGKSSFLKALGLAVYLAHVGFPVPATSMQTSIFKGLITTINLSDNINRGYSHYFSEVKRLKETALKISGQDNMFIIFDELFRGTNVKDAYDASLATITALSKIKNSVFLVSTHIVEIAVDLRSFENVSFKYFDSKIDNNKLVFDYKLKNGVSSETLGYYIFKNEGITEILEQAAIKHQFS